MNKKNQAIIFIILAGLSFAFMSFFVRLAGDMPTFQKAFFRNAVAAAIAFVMMLKSKSGFSIGKGNYIAMLLRCGFGTLGILLNFYAIDHLHISDANILNKLSPFFAIIVSGFVLKEKAKKREWIAVIVAFIGALFVIKPSFNAEVINSCLGVLGGFCAGAAYTFVRKLGQNGVNKAVIVFSFSAFSCLSLLPISISYGFHMTANQLFMIIMAGISAACGQFSITAAYSRAAAKDISVFDYSQVVFAAALGFIFLNQIPDIVSIIGYFIIISMAVYKTLSKE